MDFVLLLDFSYACTVLYRATTDASNTLTAKTHTHTRHTICRAGGDGASSSSEAGEQPNLAATLPGLSPDFPTAPPDVHPLENDFGVPLAHASLVKLRADTKAGLGGVTSKTATLLGQVLSKHKALEAKWAKETAEAEAEAEAAAAAEAALAADGEAGGEAAGGEAAGGEVGGEAGGEALDLEGAESSVDAPPSDDVENAEGAAAEGA